MTSPPPAAIAPFLSGASDNERAPHVDTTSVRGMAFLHTASNWHRAASNGPGDGVGRGTAIQQAINGLMHSSAVSALAR